MTCRLYGSLGATGRGHGSDKAVLLGQPAGAVPGLEPVTFLERAWGAADAGGGWPHCDVVSPGACRLR